MLLPISLRRGFVFEFDERTACVALLGVQWLIMYSIAIVKRYCVPSLSRNTHHLFSSPFSAAVSRSAHRSLLARTMSSTTTMIKPSKANIGVYTNPNHDLWLADASPSLEEVQKGEGLADGEVTVAIKSTGICGYETSTSQLS